MDVCGSIAYVEQEPFIITGSVEENITFGVEYNHSQFTKAIEVACLYKDLANLPSQQKTVIGERGVNVSGG